MTQLVLSVIGDDRTGLVDALATPIAEVGGSWERSSLARLAGKFAGIVAVSVPADRVDELTRRLGALNDADLLDVRLTEAVDTPPSSASTVRTIALVGSDRPGIVAEIARVLAAHGVSIEELDTATTSAPMSGEPLFEASATLRIPAATGIDALRTALEDIANELMVDLDFVHGDGAGDDDDDRRS